MRPIKKKELIRRGERSAQGFCDSCMVVSPASGKLTCMMVNSGKMHKYVLNLCGVRGIFAGRSVWKRRWEE